ncbi:hypothetical protein [Gynurincola endophyticus]|uniref:hypothetical protein n=1 Tax=Gynurincola endophyticus TaxID=2479004 RepID=UPI000F8E7ADA|nr:hypothetical protein [Gynurincola endophyticus]
MNKELVFLRTFAITTAVLVVTITSVAFKQTQKVSFDEIDVQRINIVEADGTVKMVITNVDRFPNGKDTINGRPTNVDRKKRSGMLFFNEEGMECGGFIYDGSKRADGHSAGMSLTYDQYDGDQVMQLLMQDYKKGDKRTIASSLVFNDGPLNATQQGMDEIFREIDEIAKTDPAKAREKYKEYEQKGLIGGVQRIKLGQTPSENNGLFLFDNQGKTRAMFYVDKNNNAKLVFYDGNGKIVSSFPE